MKYLYALLFLLFLQTYRVQAQKSPLYAYAITSGVQGQQAWTEVKRLNLQNGEVVRPVFETRTSDFEILNARTGRSLSYKEEREGKLVDNGKLPFSSFAAACAYDKKHNRLYYTPMYINQLRYFDLNASVPKVYYFEGEEFTKASNLTTTGNQITRMTFGADGNGYALSNDAQHLIRFTTGKNPLITDLGVVADAPSNGTNTITSQCSSWGGDIVGAADGSLYLISANHLVYRIDVSTMQAEYLTRIEGLPSGFTTNGAVVSDEGKLVVGSAGSDDGYYQIDMNKWSVEKFTQGQMGFRTSDLANGNLAFDNKPAASFDPLFSRTTASSRSIAIYPNPVSQGFFRMQFNLPEKGRYEVQLVDLTGRVLQQKFLHIAFPGQVATMQLSRQVAQGAYFVKVLTEEKKMITSEKVMIQ